MPEFNRLVYYDLRQSRDKLPVLVGRGSELSRVKRIINRKLNNNCIVTGATGIGKTAFAHGLAKDLSHDPLCQKLTIVSLEASSLKYLDTSSESLLDRYLDALGNIKNETVIIIDGFGSTCFNYPALARNIMRALQTLAQGSTVRLILTAQEREYDWLKEQNPAFWNLFEELALKPQPINEQVAILRNKLPTLSSNKMIKAQDTVLELIVSLCQRFAQVGGLPGSSIKVLDEALAQAWVDKTVELTEAQVYKVISEKINIPLAQLGGNEKERLKNLEQNLNSAVIGQGQGIRAISSLILRAKLGLRAHNRPLASFLLLGPSGVGKTEMAKELARLVFGPGKNFLRLDMSEFGEAHTVQRLLGAPPGYVGYEAGGGLTNPVLKEPHSLVLLDELEKADTKAFDIFLQVLDDGRLTSGMGEAVDFTQTIVMATSNIGVTEIINGFKSGKDLNSPQFLESTIVPQLTRHFRPEFLNRFDAILVFKPLTEADLLAIARLEVSKIEKRLAKHRVKFALDDEVLKKKIATLADPKFGARPVKRYVEQVCENLISKKLMQG